MEPKFKKIHIENQDNPLCTLENTDDEDQLLNCLRADDMCNKLSRILNFNRTPAIQEIYDEWNGNLRTRNLQKRLNKATSNSLKKEIEHKMEEAIKSTNIIRLSAKQNTP